MSLPRPILACFILIAIPAFASANGFIERITPPVLERGKTTRVEVFGKNLDQAEDLWFSLPVGRVRAKAIESQSDRAVFEVTTTAEAPVGICGIRVATRHGLSNVQLMLIDDLPAMKGEANKTLKLPCSLWGHFREAEIDKYSFTATVGQELSFEAVASRFGKDADPLVTIRDAKGKIIAERDNDPGLYYDSRFAVKFREAGTYTVEIRDSRYRGSEHHQYVLRIGKFPAGRVAVPSAVGSQNAGVKLPEVSDEMHAIEIPKYQGPLFATLKRKGDDGSAWVPITCTDAPVTVAKPEEATAAVIPGVLCGVLRTPNEKQTFLLELAKGQSIQIRGEAKALNSPADLEIAILDAKGKVLRKSGDGKDEPTLEFTAPAAGQYLLTVRDQLRDGGDAFAYRITISDALPIQVTAAVEGLTIPQSSWQPIPLTLTRGGVKGPIKLKLLDAPAGVTLSPDTFNDNETTLVARLSATASTPLGVSTLQIVAEGADGQQTLVRTTPLIDRQLINVDLILHALREDQKRLPPSVEDRFALQITPPSPFAFELPEAAVTLARYQQAEVPVVTTRTAGFAGPIRFNAVGGQLWHKSEGRTRVYAEFPDATSEAPQIAGVIHSKILSNLAKSRIDVTATGEHEGRRVSLIRTFDLTLTTAYSITAEPAKLSLLPGESTKVQLTLTRQKTFDGPVSVALPKFNGVNLPETIVFAKGQTTVEIIVEVITAAQPGRLAPQARSTAQVSGYEEEVRGVLFEIDVRKPPEPPKKK
jgi:hypothetical protein